MSRFHSETEPDWVGESNPLDELPEEIITEQDDEALCIIYESIGGVCSTKCPHSRQATIYYAGGVPVDHDIMVGSMYCKSCDCNEGYDDKNVWCSEGL